MSPVSGNGGDESFLDFMSRMLHQYTKEEEMRAKHQSTLLELREKAIKEKTEAQLKWLKIKKGYNYNIIIITTTEQHINSTCTV